MKKKISGSVTDRNLFTKSFKKQGRNVEERYQEGPIEDQFFYKLKSPSKS